MGAAQLIALIIVVAAFVYWIKTLHEMANDHGDVGKWR
jgi:hypothetical protein